MKRHPGEIINNVQLIECLGYKDTGWKTQPQDIFWKCKCLVCGNTFEASTKRLSGKTAIKNCGCTKHLPKIDIHTKQRFGRLTVLDDKILVPNRGYKYLCQCDCGNKLYVRVDNLLNGTTKSCGCIHDELFRQNSQKAYKTNFQNDTNVPHLFSNDPQKNNTSGYKGVSYHKGTKMWSAVIGYKKKRYHLGYYHTPEEAHRAVEEARTHFQDDFMEWYQKNSKSENRKEVN